MSSSLSEDAKYLRLTVTAHICPEHPGLKGRSIERLKSEYFYTHGKGQYHYFSPEQFHFADGGPRGVRVNKMDQIMREIINLFRLKKNKVITVDDIHMFIPMFDGAEIGVGTSWDQSDTYKKLEYYFLVELQNDEGRPGERPRKRYIDVSIISIYLDEYSNDNVFTHVELEGDIPFSDFLTQTNLQNLYDISEVFGKAKVIQSIK